MPLVEELVDSPDVFNELTLRILPSCPVHLCSSPLLITPSSNRKMGNGRLKRLLVIGLGLTTIFLGSVLLLYPSPDLSAEQEIVHRIAELTAKLQHANGLNDQRKSDLQLISGQFGSLVRLVKEHQDQYEDNKSPLNALLAEYTKQGFTNPNFSRSFDLTLPSVTAFLPNTVFILKYAKELLSYFLSNYKNGYLGEQP